MSSKFKTTPLPTIPTTPSSIFADSPFMQGGPTGLNEVASTPPPTTPPPPPPDPNDYEKSIYKDRINEQELFVLKEQVRILKGLPQTVEKEKRKINCVKPPKLDPRPTLTSQKRKELQQHRMLVRCANLKDKYREYEKQPSSDDADQKFRELRSEAMAKTSEEINYEFDMEELENLRTLATKAKEHEVTAFKETHGSRLRYRFNRGQPILSDNFRNAYDDYFKPPFTLCKNVYQPKIYNLPKIDKQKEVWLVPFDDEVGIPLHRQLKSPDPIDKRSKREKERPPVKPGKRTPMSEWKNFKNRGTTKRPPWGGAHFGCALNVGSFK